MMRVIYYFRSLLLFAQGNIIKSVLAWIAILLFVVILVCLISADHQFIGYRLRIGLGFPTKSKSKSRGKPKDLGLLTEEETVSLFPDDSNESPTSVSEEPVSAAEEFSEEELSGSIAEEEFASEEKPVSIVKGEPLVSSIAEEEVFDSVTERFDEEHSFRFVIGVQKAVPVKNVFLAKACGMHANLVKEFLIEGGFTKEATSVSKVSNTSESVSVSSIESVSVSNVEESGIPEEPVSVAEESSASEQVSVSSIESVNVSTEAVSSEENSSKKPVSNGSVEEFIDAENQSLDLEWNGDFDNMNEFSESSFVANFRSIIKGAEEVVATLNSIRVNKNFNSYSFESLSDQVGDLYNKLRVMGGVLCDDQFAISSDSAVDFAEIQEAVESIASSELFEVEDSDSSAVESSEVKSVATKPNDYSKPAERAVLTDLEAALLLGIPLDNADGVQETSESIAEETSAESSASAVEDPFVSSVEKTNADTDRSIEKLFGSGTINTEETDEGMERSIAWLESMVNDGTLDSEDLSSSPIAETVAKPVQVSEESTIAPVSAVAETIVEPMANDGTLDSEDLSSSPITETVAKSVQVSVEPTIAPAITTAETIVEPTTADPVTAPVIVSIPEPAPIPVKTNLEFCIERYQGFEPVTELEDFRFSCKLKEAFVLSNKEDKLYFSNTSVKVNGSFKPWKDRKIAFRKGDDLDIDTGIIAKLSEKLSYNYAVDKEKLLNVHGLKITDFYFDEQESLHAEFFALGSGVVSFDDELIVLKVSAK